MLELNVKNLASIKEANLTINKINIIGGINASGKTILSKLLYRSKILQGDYLTNSNIKSYRTNFINYWGVALKMEKIPIVI